MSKDEDNNPEKYALEKVLRLKRRFRIVKTKPSYELFEKVFIDVEETIIAFTQMVRKKLNSNVRGAATALLTCYVHFRDIINGLIKSKVCRPDEFKWQMQMKYFMRNMLEACARAAEGGTIRRLNTEKIEIDCEVFGNTN